MVSSVKQPIYLQIMLRIVIQLRDNRYNNIPPSHIQQCNITYVYARLFIHPKLTERTRIKVPKFMKKRTCESNSAKPPLQVMLSNGGAPRTVNRTNGIVITVLVVTTLFVGASVTGMYLMHKNATDMVEVSF